MCLCVRPEKKYSEVISSTTVLFVILETTERIVDFFSSDAVRIDSGTL